MIRAVKNAFLIFNPSSKSYQGQKKWPAIFERMNKSSIVWSYAMTQGHLDGQRLAFEAAQKGFDAVIAVGGDGTINEVISGISAYKEKDSSSQTRFGVIYTGTSPDFCAWHSLSLEPDVIMNSIFSGKTRNIDLCKIEHFCTQSQSRVSRFFSCSANFGLGAEIARGANSGLREKFGDGLGTFLSMIKAIAGYKPVSFNLIADGKKLKFDSVQNIFAGKNPNIASGIKLKLDISDNDGKMFVVVLSGISRFRLLPLLPSVYTGGICKRFKPIFCSKLEITTDNNVGEVEYDGDPQGTLPASISVKPSFLPLLG